MNTLNWRSAFLDECGVGPLWVRRHVEMVKEITYLEVVEPVATVTPMLAASLKEAAKPIMATSMPAHIPVVNDSMVASKDDASLPVSAMLVSSPKLADGMLLANPASMDWRCLKSAVAECTRCGLCQGRENTVFGGGDESAKWLFIGEGPGREEDRKGEPFIGSAGKLLNNMLAAIGVSRGANTYITNIVKCHPTDDKGRDRPPSSEEVAACLPYLQRQIALMQPSVLVALGKTAALTLLALDSTTPVSTLRGTVHRYAGLPLVVTYHPAYLLRKPSEKARAWDDLCLAMRCYAPASE
ncbi:MAG: uracil-DNA glycosylase [Glaciimonas sp.]|nr:uracil-DNA glycosylase [Glaciimonas sp.]